MLYATDYNTAFYDIMTTKNVRTYDLCLMGHSFPKSKKIAYTAPVIMPHTQSKTD